jgi:uncharacterized repeat protein (TIGR02543 family)
MKNKDGMETGRGKALTLMVGAAVAMMMGAGGAWGQTTVTASSIGGITVPVAGATPQTTGTFTHGVTGVSTANLTSWSGTLDGSGDFDYETIYKALVTLSADGTTNAFDAGWTDTDIQGFKPSGADSIALVNVSATSLELRIIYPETDASVPVTITSITQSTTPAVAGNATDVEFTLVGTGFTAGSVSLSLANAPAGVVLKNASETFSATGGTFTLTRTTATPAGTHSTLELTAAGVDKIFTLTINVGTITISTSPSSATVTEDAITGSLSVTANTSDGTSTLSYQWKQASSTTPAPGSDTDVGTNANSFTIPITLTAAGGDGGKYYYYVVVSGSKGETAQTSSVATVTVSDQPTYVVTVTNDGNGTGSASPASATAGTEIELTATPGTGYVFDKWDVVSGSVSIVSDKFNMPANAVTVQAKFKPATYAITFSAVNSGSGGLTAESPAGTSILSGAIVTHGVSVVFTAAPNAGYRVKEWTSGGSVVSGNTSNTYTLASVVAATAVTVEFEEITITVTHGVTGGNGALAAALTVAGGTAVASGSAVVYGSTVVFTAAPNAGYKVKGWTVGGAAPNGTSEAVSGAGDITLTVSNIVAAVAVTVEFEQVTYAIAFAQPANGTLAAAVGGSAISTGALVASGATVVFTATPSSSDYLVNEWRVDGSLVQTGGTYSHTVTAAATVAVTFKVDAANPVASAKADIVAALDGWADIQQIKINTQKAALVWIYDIVDPILALYGVAGSVDVPEGTFVKAESGAGGHNGSFVYTVRVGLASPTDVAIGPVMITINKEATDTELSNELKAEVVVAEKGLEDYGFVKDMVNGFVKEYSKLVDIQGGVGSAAAPAPTLNFAVGGTAVATVRNELNKYITALVESTLDNPNVFAQVEPNGTNPVDYFRNRINGTSGNPVGQDGYYKFKLSLRINPGPEPVGDDNGEGMIEDPANKYVTVNNAGSGNTTGGNAAYAAGENVNVSATANSGNHFVNWTLTTPTTPLTIISGGLNSSVLVFVMPDEPVELTANFALDVEAPVVSAAPAPPSGTAGTVYNHTFQTASGTAPFTWSVASGNLPTGLTLGSSTGAITGTPSAAGTFSFRIRAANSGGSDDKPFSILINPVPPQIGAPPADMLVGTRDVAYTWNLNNLVEPGAMPVTWTRVSGTETSTGLTFNTTTGVVSGKLTVAGNYELRVRATNSAGSAEASLPIIVNEPVPGVYTITFSTNCSVLPNCDNATVYPPSAETSVATGSKGKLSIKLPVPVWEGYGFVGWFANGDGGSQILEYDQGQTFDRNTTIYAIWEAGTSTISYNLDGGIADQALPANPTTYTTNDAFTLSNPKKTGYQFDGWSGTGIDAVAPPYPTTVTIAKGSTGLRSYTAHWRLEEYTISYNFNGGTEVTANERTYTFETPTFSLYDDVERAGYEFIGWTGSNGSTPQKGVSIALGNTGAKAYTANWEIKRYSIKYDLNYDGKTAERIYDIATADFDLMIPDRGAQYTFDGWIGPDIMSPPQKKVTIRPQSPGFVLEDKEYTAQWSPTAWTITFAADGGKTPAGAAPAPAKTDEHWRLAEDLPFIVKTGYDFGGWFTHETGGRKVDQNDVYTGNTTIYARWAVTEYKIIYNTNGGTVSGNPEFYTIETEPAITLKNPTRNDGSSFVGWSGTGITGAPSKSVTIPLKSTGDRVYEALWALYSITVSPALVTFPALQQPYTQQQLGTPQTVTITNIGNSPVTLAQPASTKFNLGSLTPKTIEVGATATITVIPKLGLSSGVHSETIIISNTNSTVSATVNASFEVTPANYGISAAFVNGSTSYSFPSALVGYASAPDAQTVIITNTGAAPVTPVAPVVANYTISPNPFSQTSLEPGQTRSFSIRPNGGLPRGDYGAPITVTVSESTSATARATVNVGFAVEMPTYIISASPKSLDFGALQEGVYAQPAARTVTVRNEGTGEVSLNPLNTVSDDFDITSLSMSRIAAGQSATFTVRPKANLKQNNYVKGIEIIGVNGGSQYVEATVSITPPPSPEAPSIRADALPDGAVGVAYSQKLSASGYPAPEWSLASGSLGRLTLSKDGTVSGTPAAAGLLTFTAKAKNELGEDTKLLSISVAAAPPVYTVTFNANGGSLPAGTPSSAKTGVSPVGGLDVSLPTPARAGYEFEGWFTVSAATGGEEVRDGRVFTKSETIYARWTLIKYTVNFNANGGTVTPETAETGAGGRLTLSKMPEPVWGTGRTFTGWFTEPEGGTRVDLSRVYTGDGVTLYARWTLVKYSIAYSLGGGTADPPNPASFTVEDLSFSLNEPARAGYEFTGWTGSNGKDRELSVTIDTVGGKSYTANWDLIVYTITFNPGIGTLDAGKESGKTGTGGRLSSLPTPKTENSDFVFDGWFTEPYGYGTKVEANKFSFDRDMDIYANWVEVRKVTFDPMGGALGKDTVGYTGAGGRLSTLPLPTKAGLTFEGWYTEPDTADGVRVTAGANGYVFSEDATVYAQWAPIVYVAVTFSAGPNGAMTASVDSAAITSGGSVQRGKNVAFTAFPANTYVVAGWTVNGTPVSGNAAKTFTLDSVKAATTITVQFTKQIAVESSGREIPGAGTGEEAAVTPITITPTAVTAGPNPVSKFGKVRFHRAGSRISGAELYLYDASGNAVKELKLTDKSPVGAGNRVVGTWDLTDNHGRPVSEGAYLVKGAVKTANGKTERVSMVIVVR